MYENPRRRRSVPAVGSCVPVWVLCPRASRVACLHKQYISDIGKRARSRRRRLQRAAAAGTAEGGGALRPLARLACSSHAAAPTLGLGKSLRGAQRAGTRARARATRAAIPAVILSDAITLFDSAGP